MNSQSAPNHLRTYWFTCFIGIWIAAGIVIAFAMPPARELAATPVAFFHIPMAVTTVVAFMLAAWHGAAWLRRRQVRSDAMSLAYAEIGAICGITATASGAIWARVNWGSYWSWDPQQIGIVATLLTYGALFSLRSAVEDEDKQRNLWAVYALFGALAAVFWTMVFRRLLPSLHPDHTILKSSMLFRFALWFNIAGYIMVVVRLAGLRARLEMARQYLKDSQWA